MKNTSRRFWTTGSPPQVTERIVSRSKTPQKRNFFIATMVHEMNPVVAVKDDLHA